MIKSLSNFNKLPEQAERFYFFGYRFGYFESHYNNYISYKMGNVKKFSEEKLKEMEVLDVLERLGFSMQQIGTYLYKNMIIRAMEHLDEKSSYKTMDPEILLHQMKSPFSQFYVDVARNDLDMGIKTFHAHIENALDNINYDKTDAALLYEINSNFSDNSDYGDYAFYIGKYLVDSEKKKANEQAVKCITLRPSAGLQI